MHFSSSVNFGIGDKRIVDVVRFAMYRKDSISPFFFLHTRRQGMKYIYIPLRAASRKLFGKSRVSMGKEVNDIISGAYCGRASRREKIRDLWVDLDLD